MISNKNMKVEFFPSEGGMSEIFQQTGFHFAFVTAPKHGQKQCHKMVKCRDFLHDAVRAKHQNNSCSIFGFHYNSAQHPPIDLKRMRMLVERKDAKDVKDGITFEQMMVNSLRLLNHYERLAKVSLSRLYRVEKKDSNGKEKKDAFMFIGPVFWLKSPYLTSMYTYLIRLGDKGFQFSNHAELMKEYERVIDEYKKAGKGDNDLRYLNQCKDFMHVVVKKAKSLLFLNGNIDPALNGKASISNYHNCGGIWSLSKAQTFDQKLNARVKEEQKEQGGKS